MNIKFLGEQDGAPERELKDTLMPVLEGARAIRAAYLTSADYQDGSSPSAVLCLRSERGADAELVEKIGEIFSAMFSCDQHLDVYFISENEENEVRTVCSPFYVAIDT